MCVFNLSDAARDWCVVRILVAYDALQTCHRFTFEQEPVFWYKSVALILSPETVIRVAAWPILNAWSVYVPLF